MQFQIFFVNFDDLNINCFVLSNKMRRLLRLKDPEWKMALISECECRLTGK